MKTFRIYLTEGQIVTVRAAHVHIDEQLNLVQLFRDGAHKDIVFQGFRMYIKAVVDTSCLSPYTDPQEPRDLPVKAPG